jgi:hypothetical protein
MWNCLKISVGFFFLFSSEVFSQLVPLIFNPAPLPYGQIEYITINPAYLSFIGNPGLSRAEIYIKLGPVSPGTCLGPNIHLSPSCVGQFQSFPMENFHYELPFIYAYRSLNLPPQVSFFVQAHGPLVNGTPAWTQSTPLNVANPVSLVESPLPDFSPESVQNGNNTADVELAHFWNNDNISTDPLRYTNLNDPDALYVSNGTYGPMGSDTTGTGTSAQPYLTLRRAIQETIRRYTGTSLNGRKIILRGGIYVNGRIDPLKGTQPGDYDLRFASGTTGFQFRGTPLSPFVVAGYALDPTEPMIDNYQIDPIRFYSGDPSEIVQCPRFRPQNPNPYIDSENLSQCLYGGAHDISGVSGFVINRLTLVGAGWALTSGEALNIDNVSYTILDSLKIFDSGKWGAQAFGNPHHLAILNSWFIGSQLEHGLYIAGGTWNAFEVPRYFVIAGNVFGYNGRTGLQINGTMEGLKIFNNLSYRNNLGGFTLTGITNYQFYNNIAIDNLQQPLVANFHYVDTDQWPILNPSRLLNWKNTHFRAFAKAEIYNNTLVVPQVAWNPHGSGVNPSSFDVIRIHDWNRVLPNGESSFLGHGAIFLENNILQGVSHSKVISIGTNENTPQTDLATDFYKSFSREHDVTIRSNLMVTQTNRVDLCNPRAIDGNCSFSIPGFNFTESFSDLQNPNSVVNHRSRISGNILNQSPQFRMYLNPPQVWSEVQTARKVWYFGLYQNQPTSFLPNSDLRPLPSSPANQALSVGKCAKKDFLGRQRSINTCVRGALLPSN